MSGSKDLGFQELPPTAWGPDDVMRSLETVVQRASDHADEAARWYARTKKWKRVAGRSLRLAAILLTAAGGVLPVLQQIFGDPSSWVWSPAWAAVLGALALLMIAIDHFFGFSSAWMRFMTAFMQIRQAREKFVIEWQAACASFGGATPTPEQVASVLSSAGALVTGVEEIVAAETAAWVGEFRAVLQQAEESAKAAAVTPQTGSLNVTVTNGESADPPGWSLALDRGASVPLKGKTAGFVGLAPGDHVVSIAAKLGGVPMRAETVVAIRAGGVTQVELSLA